MNEKIKKIFKIIAQIFSYIAIGLGTIFFINNKKSDKEISEKAEEKKEETKNELKEKTADEIAADSPNPDSISSGIKTEQDRYRERIRDSLKGKL